MEKVSSLIEYVYRIVVAFFATAIFSIILLLSTLTTCFITSELNEITFFCKDDIVVSILLLVAMVMAVFLAVKKGIIAKVSKKLQDDAVFKRVKLVLYLVILIMGIGWVMLTQFVPGSDQLDVLDCAYKFRNGNTSMLEPGGYLDMWNNQLGLTMFEYLVGSVVGDFNILFYQLFNCLGVVLLYKNLVDILEALKASRLTQILTLLCGVLFYPMIMYTSFVYGTIWSVALAVMAFYYELKFLNEHRPYQLVFCGILIGGAVQVKNNVLILMIAMIIYGIVYAIKKQERVERLLVLLAAIIVGFIVCDVMPDFILQAKTDYSLEQGVSPWAFVAMGLQDEQHAPGWYNGYNYNTYLDSGCITEVQEKVVKENIAERMALFKENSHYTFEFFSMKIASMWTEPTYQAFWVNQIRNHRVDFPQWLNAFFSARGYTASSSILDAFQIFIFAGSALWLLFEDKCRFMERSFFVLCTIGGFIFHLFWEAKSQYSITYVVLMIPMAMMGFEQLAREIQCLTSSDKTNNIKVSKFSCIVFVAFASIYLAIYFYDASDCLTADTGYYEMYLETMQMPYTNESVRDINIMKAEREDYKRQSEIYWQLLVDNGIMENE